MKSRHKPTEPVEPSWDVSDPIGSFRRYGEHLHQKARWMFLKDGHHAEMMFLFRTGGAAMLMLVGGDREEFADNIRRIIHGSGIIGVIHVCEAWTRMGGKNDHITKQIILGEMGVSDLRPEDRGEALFTSIQSSDEQSTCWVDPSHRDAKTGKASLGRTITIREIGGRFGGLFK
jgi:hypothetical protein